MSSPASPPGAAETLAADSIELLLPSERRFDGIVQLVIGGVGTRCELPYDTVDELQLAVSGVLPSARDASTTVEISVGEVVAVTIGPLIEGTATDPALRRVLDRLVARATPVSREDGEWVTLEVARPAQ